MTNPTDISSAYDAALADPGPSNGEEWPCPCCGADAIYYSGLDRYVHANGADNRRCWAHISQGKTDPVTPVLADQVLARSALHNLPDPEPLIGNVLDRGTFALLYRERGVGKSFIAQDWGASVATNRPWQGRPVSQSNVLYIAAEGAFGLKGRMQAWETGWHTKIEDGALDVLPKAVNLTDFTQVGNLGALIQWAGYELIIVDTLSRCMLGVDENSAKECGAVLEVLHRLREKTPGGRGVVLAVHHSGKDGKTFRGSSVFEAGADTVYSATRDGAVILLERKKRKDGPEHDRHELKLDPIQGTNSAVLGVDRRVDKPERADRLLSTFIHHFVHTGASKADLRKVAEMPDATFFRAISDLLECGDLINDGTEKRPFYKVAGENLSTLSTTCPPPEQICPSTHPLFRGVEDPWMDR